MEVIQCKHFSGVCQSEFECCFSHCLLESPDENNLGYCLVSESIFLETQENFCSYKCNGNARDLELSQVSFLSTYQCCKRIIEPVHFNKLKVCKIGNSFEPVLLQNNFCSTNMFHYCFDSAGVKTDCSEEDCERINCENGIEDESLICGTNNQLFINKYEFCQLQQTQAIDQLSISLNFAVQL